MFLAACGSGTTQAGTSAASTTAATVSTSAAATTAVADSTAPAPTTVPPTTAAPSTTVGFSLSSLPGKIAFQAPGCAQELTPDDLEAIGSIESVEEAAQVVGGMMDNTMQICVINPDGSGLKVVSDPKRDAGYPGWSNDGNTIYFVDERGTMYVEADGSNLRKRDKKETPVPGESPDGKWYVFAPLNGIGFSITSIGSGSGVATTRKVVTTSGACCQIARWSPDSKYLLYTEYEDSGRSCLQLWKVDIETKERTKLTGSETPAASIGACVYPDSGRWSPDGTAILFEAELKGQDVERPYLVAPDGSDPRPLLPDNAFSDPNWVLGAIAWSPDGRAVVLSAVTETGVGNGAYIVSADGKNVLPIDVSNVALVAAAELAWAPGL